MKNSTDPTAYTTEWSGATSSYLTLTDGARLRYIEMGHGEPLLLLHTLRTQLDHFQKLAPLLSDRFRLILLDLPGHGHSSIDPKSLQDEPYFRHRIVEAADALGLKQFSVGGESIGASLALTLAATLPAGRIKQVYALNPYDYGERFGGGVRRSKHGSIIGLFGIFRQWTIEAPFLLKLVLSGGFATDHYEPESLFRELVRTGNRKGYRRAEYQLHKHWRSWLAARELYGKVTCPVTLLYGEHDWSLPEDRERNKQLIHPKHYKVIPATGHFSALENPQAVASLFA